MPRTCRACGCTDDRACIRVLEPDDVGDLFSFGGISPAVELPDGSPVETCTWVKQDLCSGCAPGAVGWTPPAEQEAAGV